MNERKLIMKEFKLKVQVVILVEDETELLETETKDYLPMLIYDGSIPTDIEKLLLKRDNFNVKQALVELDD